MAINGPSGNELKCRPATSRMPRCKPSRAGAEVHTLLIFIHHSTPQDSTFQHLLIKLTHESTRHSKRPAATAADCQQMHVGWGCFASQEHLPESREGWVAGADHGRRTACQQERLEKILRRLYLLWRSTDLQLSVALLVCSRVKLDPST